VIVDDRYKWRITKRERERDSERVKREETDRHIQREKYWYECVKVKKLCDAKRD
jgi:hypothetical protein